MSQAYFRFPTISLGRIAFTSEDDLWEVPAAGGVARRLTAGLGSFQRPQYSPDGSWLAFSSAEEGHLEVFVMPATGGEIRRLTYLGSQSAVCGWLDESTILFSSTGLEPQRTAGLCQVNVQGGMPKALRLGPAASLVVSKRGEAVLERNANRSDPAYWKRYRGGTAGKLFMAPSLEGEFKPFLSATNGNLSRPLWVEDRVYFTSDHEGVANLYSCSASGADLRAETRHKDYYVRGAATDGERIVYTAGGDLFLFTPGEGARKVAVDYHSQRTQRQRRFVDSEKYFESARLSRDGEKIVTTVRGQIQHFRCWDGPVGIRREAGSRFRLAQYLPDDTRLAMVVDRENGDECLEIFNTADGSAEYLSNPEWGRFTAMVAAPEGSRVAFANHRNELWIADLDKKSSTRVARNEHTVMGDFDWSPDGRWLAYSQSLAWNRSRLCIADAETGDARPVTEPLLEDFAPSFDPDGKYLYFLSKREFDPVYDSLQFELSFPKGILPCLLTLKKEYASPFLETRPDSPAEKTDAKPVEIDFDGIESRLLAFPMPEAIYTKIVGIKGKVLIVSQPVEGALNSNWLPKAPPAKSTVECYDFKIQKAEPVATCVSGISTSADGAHVLLRVGNKLRVVKAGEKADENLAKEPPSRKSGWIDWSRVKTQIEPASEWKQMLHEVWRLQRDHFWREDMSKINWRAVLNRYLPLVERINTRSEFGDLVWEMQGELGTSHAYDMGGDYRAEPSFPVGMLGAEMSFDAASSGYRIDHLLRSDSWKAAQACPLSAPGVNAKPGDVLLAVNGQKLSATVTPAQLLLHQANQEVMLTLRSRDDGQSRNVRVRAIPDEKPLRYREWVERNREYVAKSSMGRVGYIHIPDMGAAGFAEFHRHFLRDFNQDALIVDVRFNAGGHVSQLLLEKLCRSRMGADSSRWFGTMPFPAESPAGPMVALTNEYAGSDGDIFSHSFKLKKAGPLIGRRTWGGVIGIWPRHTLVDGGVTTQPEFSHWFMDVGWQLENHGAEPDIDVDILPHDYRRGFDPQLDRGLREVLHKLEDHPPFRPVFTEYPDLGFEI